MKKIVGTLMAVAVVALIAAGCGGGSSDSSSTTPSATSSQTTTAMANASQWMSDTTVLIQGALGGGTATSTKADSSISCVGTYGGFTCVIWDDLGSATSTDHKCDVTGTYNTTLYSFDLEYDCYNFEPASDVTVDGNWTASITYNGASSSASASKDVSTVKETSDSCDVEEISNICGQTYTFEGGSCTATCDGASSCTTTNAVVIIEWTVGSRGINMTDACGTYVVEPGTSSSMAFCMPSNYQFIMSSTMNGTINGTSIDENIEIDCTYTY